MGEGVSSRVKLGHACKGKEWARSLNITQGQDFFNFHPKTKEREVVLDSNVSADKSNYGRMKKEGNDASKKKSKETHNQKWRDKEEHRYRNIRRR